MARSKAAAPDNTARTSKRKRRTGVRPGGALILCTIAYAFVLAAVSLLNVIGPERFWLGSLNLYLPQWPWALPCVVLMPWYLLKARRWIWVPMVLLAWVVGPIMGWSFGPARLAPAPHGTRLRIMTYNVKWGRRDAKAVLANVARADADVIVMQHSSGAIDGPLATLKKPGWRAVRQTEYTILSRFPISDATAQPLTVDRRRICLRCVLHIGSQRVTLYDVHTITPRRALDSVADRGADGAEDLQVNANVREAEADGVATLVQRTRGPVIVAGDLNAPVQSTVCQKLFRCDLRDAYSEAGMGYGYTYGQSTIVGYPYVRIDHIFVSPEWKVQRCSEGSPRGSDHSPVIADLVLPAASSGAP